MGRARGRVRAVAMVIAVVVAVGGTGCSSGGGDRSEDRAAPAQDAPTGPATPGVFSVVDLDPAQVHRLSVESKGAQVALVRTTAGTWLAEPGTPEVVSGLLAERETEVLPLQAYRRLDTDPDRPDFGLVDPEFVVRVQDAAGVEQAVSVGVVTFSGAGYYARRLGDPHVYLLVRRSVDDLRSLVRGERVNSPRTALENEILSESPDADPEEVTNPWLAQVLEEAP
ncbi:MAG: DUF4340 domain-containing protein [Actinomycetota bacterium]|nr:DUF4340 domain-containing protein [Actinomycetota bacterium]